VFALADMANLFVNELASLRGWRFALAPGSPRSLECSFLRHSVLST
jgi:hypothetical protein